ncbi:MAG TPA: hypothetical protein VD833_14960 [Vicinamibacterales bacterium]|nr:hypothetical protein [Vicinamibacterales bacterium]
MSKVKSARFLAICAAILCCGFAQQMTIPDHVAATGGMPVFLPVIRDLAPVPLSDLAAADAIVYGKLVRQRAYMNSRKRDIYTDYEIVAERVIVDRLRVMSSLPQPVGQSRPVVTIYGGEIVVDKTKVVMDDMSLIRRPEHSGPLLMFLRRTSEANRFELYGDVAGLFEVKAVGRIQSLLKHPEKDKEVGDLTLEQLIQLVTEERRDL